MEEGKESKISQTSSASNNKLEVESISDANENVTNQEQNEDKNETLSKRAQKRKILEEGRKDYWKFKREKQLQKKLERKQVVEEEKRQKSENNEAQPERDRAQILEERRKRKESRRNVEYKGTLVIDLSFDELMQDREIRSLAIQLSYGYSSNKNSDKPIGLVFSSFGGRLKAQLDTSDGFDKWPVRKEEKHFMDLFPKEKLVYLSSESDNVLQTIDLDKVYVIGGLVDHNRHKGLTFKKAQEFGIATAQLPLSEYVDMKTRKVLAVNHVMDILIRYASSNDWTKAMENSIPKRKEFTAKQSEKKDNLQESKETNDAVTNVEDKGMK